MLSWKTLPCLVVALAALTACSSQNKPEPALSEASETQPSGVLTASQIMQTLSNNSFRYKRGDRTGTITFFPDGTFTYQENGKGEGAGIWQASEGKLCQAFNPTSFLPKGTRSECHPFTSTGGAYRAGTVSFESV